MTASPSMDTFFEPRPEQWGLRGDSLLWEEMRQGLIGVPAPALTSQFVQAIEGTYRKLAGRPLLPGGEFYVKRFDAGGMSSGLVSPGFWREKALPLLAQRFLAATTHAPVDCRKFTEKELDKLLEAALASNPEFLEWLLARTKFASAGCRYHWSRSNHPWGKVEIDVPSADGGPPQRIWREGETDILAVFEGRDGQRVSLHIENKRPGGKFLPYQAEGYAARAAKWANSPKHGNYTDWQTMLVAPQAVIDQNQAAAEHFDLVIAYEALQAFIPAFTVVPLDDQL